MTSSRLLKYWYAVHEMLVATSAVKNAERYATNLLTLANHGLAEVWEIVQPDGKFLGVIITAIDPDVVTEVRRLVILNLVCYGKVPHKTLYDGMARLERFAKQNKCSEIVGITVNPQVVSIMKKAGFALNTHGRKEL